MFAQACADAMGRDFEFGDPSPSKVRALYYSPSPLYLTDDTQMAMFGMEALTKAMQTPDILSYSSAIRSAYLRWYDTQTTKVANVNKNQGLLAEPLMYRREAPGLTCLSSLAYLQEHHTIRPNQSTGCGAVMRLLPFCFMKERYDADIVQSIARYSAELTHQGQGVPEAVEAYTDIAMQLLEGRLDHPWATAASKGTSITAFGEGWTSKSCVMMALWAFSKATDFEELCVKAICHSGDSDSVAAVAGSLWGLAGRKVPMTLINRLAHREILKTLVKDFILAMRKVHAR